MTEREEAQAMLRTLLAAETVGLKVNWKRVIQDYFDRYYEKKP